MYDAIIVGARCAGASTATLLARQGHKVLLVDRARFPSDIPHGHFIHQGGPLRLQRWGLLDQIMATGCPPITTMSTEWDNLRLEGTDVTLDGVPCGIAPRRSALDNVLVNAAVDAGAELREGFVVEDFIADDDRLRGIRGRALRGLSKITEHAAITIGADGRHSHLARAVEAPVLEASPTQTFYYFSYWGGVPIHGMELYDRKDKVIIVFPTNDDLLAVFVSWSIPQLPVVRADIEGEFMRAIDSIPELAARIRSGYRAEHFRGAIDLPNYVRKPFGDGWALVGDAGCHKDPYLALGICDGLRDAEFLAEAVHTGLTGEDGLECALADYEQRRNDATLPDYHRNLHLAQFRGLPPEHLQLRRAIQGNHEATNQYYKATETLIPPETFFAPENVQRLVASRQPKAEAITR